MQLSFFENPRPDLPALLNKLAEAEYVYVKFLAANDLTKISHQAGIYFAKDTWPMFFPEPGKKGENKEKIVLMEREDGPPIEGRYKWYGEKKSEYRLTRMKDFFRGREDDLLGSLFLLTLHQDRYHAWVLSHDEDVEAVLSFFGITPADANGLMSFDLEDRTREDFEAYLQTLGDTFPPGEDLAQKAQELFEKVYSPKKKIDPDEAIVKLMQMEYMLFRHIERHIYRHHFEFPFRNIESLMAVSLEIANRRKSRAGRSLEYHLIYIFQRMKLPFSFNETTEGVKRPDFIFPGIDEYRNASFLKEKLFMLGAKTSCKDRWRQVVTEADRIQTKHLFTLQQGFTSNQLQEMHEAHVVPVIPREYHKACKPEDQHRLKTLEWFIQTILATNGEEATLF